MIIEAATVKLYANWVHSLKEKRMVVKSILSKVQNKFNVSIAEVDKQDIHQTAMIGIVCVAATVALANSTIDKVISFIEKNAEGEIIDIQREMR